MLSRELPEKAPKWKTKVAALIALGTLSVAGCGENANATSGPTTSEISTSDQAPVAQSSSELPTSTSGSISATENPSKTETTSDPDAHNPLIHPVAPQEDLGYPSGQYERFVDPSLLITSNNPEDIVKAWCTNFEVIANHSLGANGTDDPGTYVRPAIGLLVSTSSPDNDMINVLTNDLRTSTLGSEGVAVRSILPHDLTYTCDSIKDVKILEGTPDSPTKFSAEFVTDVTIKDAGSDSLAQSLAGSGQNSLNVFTQEKATYGEGKNLVSGMTWKLSSSEPTSTS